MLGHLTHTSDYHNEQTFLSLKCNYASYRIKIFRSMSNNEIHKKKKKKKGEAFRLYLITRLH